MPKQENEYDLVRVRDGQVERTTTRVAAQSAGLEVLDKDAADAAGRPLPNLDVTDKAGNPASAKEK